MTGNEFDAVLRNFPGLAIVTDRRGKVLYVNDHSHACIGHNLDWSAPVSLSKLLTDNALTARLQNYSKLVLIHGAVSGSLEYADSPNTAFPRSYTGYLDTESELLISMLWPVEVRASADEPAVVSAESGVAATPQSEAARSQTAQSQTTRAAKAHTHQLQKRNQLLTALNKITVRMMDHQPVDMLLRNISELILELTDASSSFIHIVKGNDQWLELVAISGEKVASIGQRLEKGQGLAGKAWESGKLEYVEDYQRLAVKLDSILTTTQACALPVIVNDRVVGVLGIMYNDYRETISDQFDLIQQFATLASIAIDKSLLLEGTRNELLRTQTMNELGTTVFNTDNFEELLETTAKAALKIIEFGWIDAWRIDSEKELKSLAGWGKSGRQIIRQPAELIERQRSSVQKWLCDWKNSDDAPVLNIDQPVLPALVASMSGDSTGSYIPCRGDDGAVIVFHVRMAGGRVFSENVRNVLSSVGKQFSVAARQQQLQRKVKFQAYHDGLTTLPNRIQFDLSLKDSIAEARKTTMRIAVMFIDLDGFKSVNDTLGHEVGDKLLVEVARRFRGELVESWVLARIGGDEFAAIISLSDTDDHIAQVGRQMLASLKVPFGIDDFAPVIGASIGVAVFPDDGDSASTLLRNADSAMYEAKLQGKNRLCRYSESNVCQRAYGAERKIA